MWPRCACFEFFLSLAIFAVLQSSSQCKLCINRYALQVLPLLCRTAKTWRTGPTNQRANREPTNNSARVTSELNLVKDGADFFGWHVNFAARIASRATAGQILVSSLL